MISDNNIQEEMMSARKIATALVLGMVLAVCGCRSTGKNNSAENLKFNRLFCWNFTNNEKDAARFAEAGVTDVLVHNKKQYDLAVKYGITPYWRCFIPTGPYTQVMTPEETRHYNYINGKDLDKKMPYRDRQNVIHARRREVNHRYGGEPVTKIDTLNNQSIACFTSDEGLVLTRKKLDKLMKDAPSGAAGMFLDYLGYMNHQGCCCEKCLSKYRKYLSDRKLKDTPENRTVFYREKLVEYYNAVIDYIKGKHPDYKIAVHVYPDFRNDPLYGNRIKADYCGQTVSWYFKFDEAKIRRYTKYVLEHARDHHPFAEGIPFIGLSTDKSNSLCFKTPEEVDHDLRTILSAGGRTVMVCNGRSIIEDGYFEVFKKYCGRK